MRLRTFAKARAGKNGDFQPERPPQTQHLYVQSSAPFFIVVVRIVTSFQPSDRVRTKQIAYVVDFFARLIEELK